MKRTAKQIQGRPHVSPRTFFDEGCSEFTKKPFNYKTERLMEYVKSGYSLKKWIIEYRNYYDDGNHEHMKGYLEQALNTYIHFFKTGEAKFFYGENPYSNILQELIPLLESSIKEAIENAPGYAPPKTRKRGNKRFNIVKIKALIDSYIHERQDYAKLSAALNIDFNTDITAFLEERDREEKLEYPYSYIHLKSLLLQNFFFAIKENYYTELYPQMGCSKNQLYYLQLFADKTNDKSNVFKKETAIDIALELIRIIYFKGKYKQGNK
jgi:hypothetical protein